MIPQQIRINPVGNSSPVIVPQQQGVLGTSRAVSPGGFGTPSAPRQLVLQNSKGSAATLPQLVLKTPSGELKLVNSISPDGTVNLQSLNSSQNSVKPMVNKTISRHPKPKGIIVPPSTRSLLLNNVAGRLASPSAAQSVSAMSEVATSVSVAGGGPLKMHSKSTPTVRELLDAKKTPTVAHSKNLLAGGTLSKTPPAVSLLKHMSLAAQQGGTGKNNASQQSLILGTKPGTTLIQAGNTLIQPAKHSLPGNNSLIQQPIGVTKAVGKLLQQSGGQTNNVIIQEQQQQLCGMVQQQTPAIQVTNSSTLKSGCLIQSNSKASKPNHLPLLQASSPSACGSTSSVCTAGSTQLTELRLIAGTSPPALSVANSQLSVATSLFQPKKVKSLLKSHQPQVKQEPQPLIIEKLDKVLSLQTQNIPQLLQTITTASGTVKKKPVVLMKDTSKENYSLQMNQLPQGSSTTITPTVNQSGQGLLCLKQITGNVTWNSRGEGKVPGVKELIEKQLQSQAPRKVHLPNYR